MSDLFKKHLTIQEIQAILTRFIVDPDTECWNWTGARVSNGYGQVRYNGYRVTTHRLMYVAFYGSIEQELQVDHLCRNRLCMKPSHLESVTQTENLKRSDAWLTNSEKTHCKRGHEFTEANTYKAPSTKCKNGHARVCRQCVKDKLKAI